MKRRGPEAKRALGRFDAADQRARELLEGPPVSQREADEPETKPDKPKRITFRSLLAIMRGKVAALVVVAWLAMLDAGAP